MLQKSLKIDNLKLEKTNAKVADTHKFHP